MLVFVGNDNTIVLLVMVYGSLEVEFYILGVCRFLDWVLDVVDYLEYTMLLSLMKLDVQ